VKEGAGSGLVDRASTHDVDESLLEVVINGNNIECLARSCSTFGFSKVVDLQGGSLLPSFYAFGPALGLSDITSVRQVFRHFRLSLVAEERLVVQEKSTSDAKVFDPLTHGELSRSQRSLGSIRAIDGLSFGGKHLVVAEESGVGKAITAPRGNGFYRGVSVAFRTGAKNSEF